MDFHLEVGGLKSGDEVSHGVGERTVLFGANKVADLDQRGVEWVEVDRRFLNPFEDADGRNRQAHPLNGEVGDRDDAV